MRIEASALRGARNLIVGLGLATALAVLAAPSLAGAQDSGWTRETTPQEKAATAKPAHKESAKKRVISIALAKGETYTIEGVAKGGSSAVKVVHNPHALVVQRAPGRIVLVGAATGTWRLNVTLADGEKVIYEVNVSAAAAEQGSLTPGSAPTVMH